MGFEWCARLVIFCIRTTPSQLRRQPSGGGWLEWLADLSSRLAGQPLMVAMRPGRLCFAALAAALAVTSGAVVGTQVKAEDSKEQARMADSGILIRVSSPDGAFLEFYEALAQSLRGTGMVYVPYPPIPPNARLAPPPPQDVIVRLDDPGAAEAFADVAVRYLTPGSRQLDFDSRYGATRVQAADGVTSALRQVLPDE